MAEVAGDLARFSSKNAENSGKCGDWGDPREKRDTLQTLEESRFATNPADLD